MADVLVLFIFTAMKNYSILAQNELANRSIQTYKKILSRGVTILTPEELEKKEISNRIKAINLRLKLDNKAQTSINKFVAASASIGTFCWGFGDVVAQMFIDRFFTEQVHYQYYIRIF